MWGVEFGWLGWPCVRSGWLAAALVCVALASLFMAGPGAEAAYPGSSLSLALSGNPAGKQMVTVTGSGTNAQANPMQIGPYNLQMFAKDATIDPSCADSWSGEEENLTADAGHEFYFAVGLSEGDSGPFAVPAKLNLGSLRTDWGMHGRILICAYSTWTYDTATSAQLSISPVPATHHVRRHHHKHRHHRRSR